MDREEHYIQAEDKYEIYNTVLNPTECMYHTKYMKLCEYCFARFEAKINSKPLCFQCNSENFIEIIIVDDEFLHPDNYDNNILPNDIMDDMIRCDPDLI